MSQEQEPSVVSRLRSEVTRSGKVIHTVDDSQVLGIGIEPNPFPWAIRAAERINEAGKGISAPEAGPDSAALVRRQFIANLAGIISEEYRKA